MITTLAARSHLPLKPVFLLSLLYLLAVIACGSSAPTPVSTSTPTLISIPKPTIVPSRPCELVPGEEIPLAITGVSVSGVVYTWSASAGLVTPPEGPAVSYIAPNTGGDVIITVTAEKDGQTSDGMITCKVIAPTQLPIDTPLAATLTPTLPPMPTPTTWTCTSYRSQKPVQKGNIPGEVKIDTPLQGTINLPFGQGVQVAGTYTGIPAGKYLWVFVYSQEADLYYPQSKDSANGWQPDRTTGQDGRWSLKVSFGGSQLCFEVIAMVADVPASQSIADQLQKWAALNNYVGYKLNGPSSADPPNMPGLPNGVVEKASIEVRTK